MSASAIFLEASTFGTGGHYAESVAVADVNGDGKLDLIITNLCHIGDVNCVNGEVSVLLGNGDGTFLPAVSYNSGGYQALAVVVADVNRDGKPDLLVVNGCNPGTCAGGVIGVLLGNGDGTFQTAVSYSSGGVSAISVAVADVNKDGKPDLLVANACLSTTCDTGGVAVLLGDGDGTFQPAINYSSGGQSASSVGVGDLNGDGNLDLVVGNIYLGNGNYTRGSVAVLLGNGDGTFQPAVNHDSGGEYAYSVAVADVNADGKPDLLVANYCSDSSCITGGAAVFLGNGDGTFQPAVSYDSGGQDPESLAVVDVNGDGRLDLLIANECASGYCQDGAVSVLLGNGDGTFQPAMAYDSAGHYAIAVAVGDVNGDGKLDVLVLNQSANGGSNGTVAVLLGKGDGIFQGAPSIAPGGQWTYSIAVGDVNGDGRPDLIVADQTSGGGTIGVLLGKGNGTFLPAVSYSSAGQYANSVVIADVNGDGRPDLIVANYDGTAGVLLGNGDGTFRAVMTYSSGGNYSYSVAVTDVNGDGRADVLVANGCFSVTNCSTGGVGVLLGKGDGTFQPVVSFSSGGQNAYWVAVADVNGDGKPDLLLANEYVGNGNDSNGTIGVLLGNGDGTFQPAVSYSSGAYEAYSVVVADINADGKPDLLVSNGCVSSSNCVNGIVGLLLGNGDGTFQAAMTIATPPMGQGALALADFNGDGKLDLASGTGDFLMLGNGDGTFQAPLVLGVTGTGIAVGDFNLDGKPDLAVGGVAILLNVSPGFRENDATTLVSSLNPSAYQQGVTFTVTVTPQGSGTPTGSLSFQDGAASLGTASLSAGKATLSISGLAVGTHNITASYSGDSNFLPSTSTPLVQTVSRATTSATLVSSADPSYLNQSVTYTAKVKSEYSGAVTGSVTFKQGSTVLGTVALVSGQASYSKTYATTGTRYITAVYSGDANNLGSPSAMLGQMVNTLPAATATKLVTSGSPTFIHQTATFKATITSTYGPIPDGETVTFYDGSTAIGTALTAGGVSTFSTSTLAARTHSIKATYAGETTFKASSGTVTQVVNLYASAISAPTSSLNPSVYGQSVTLSVAVTSTAPSAPTGTVTFKNGTTSLGSVSLNTSGVAALTTRILPAGTLSITATYNGDSETARSTSAALLETVSQATSTITVKSSLNPSLSGQAVTFTATVTSPMIMPSGTVTFMDGNNTLGTGILSAGKASYATTTLSTGSHSISAIYNGTANYKGSTSATLAQTVN